MNVHFLMDTSVPMVSARDHRLTENGAADSPSNKKINMYEGQSGVPLPTPTSYVSISVRGVVVTFLS